MYAESEEETSENESTHKVKPRVVERLKVNINSIIDNLEALLKQD